MQIRRRHGRAWLAAIGVRRNPLLRWTDRIQAWVLLVAVVVGLAIVVVCAVGGVQVYRSHVERYHDSQTHHAVMATVVETDPGQPLRHQSGIPVLAMWLVDSGGARGGENLLAYTDWVWSARKVSVGDHLRIWIDDAGLLSTPPTPPWQAGVDAAAFGVGLWLVGVGGLIVLVWLIRSPLDRIRLAQWEAEISALAEKGRRNRPQS
jgi:hypothetical protein